MSQHCGTVIPVHGDCDFESANKWVVTTEPFDRSMHRKAVCLLDSYVLPVWLKSCFVRCFLEIIGQEKPFSNLFDQVLFN